MAAQNMQTDSFDALPSANRLRTLPGDDAFRAPWTAQLLFFILYTAALLLMARGSRRLIPLLLLPLVAASLCWTAWSNDKAGRRLISWSEIDASGHALRYAALLQITGYGKGEAITLLPASFGLFQAQTKAPETELDRYQTSAAVPVALKTRNYLLSKQSFFTQGDMQIDPPISVTMTDHGPVLENRASTPSPPALLGWNGQRNPVPALRPGERWQPPHHGTQWNVASTAEQLLRARTQGGSAAVLLPHELLPQDGNVLSPIEEHGWLLIVSS